MQGPCIHPRVVAQFSCVEKIHYGLAKKITELWAPPSVIESVDHQQPVKNKLYMTIWKNKMLLIPSRSWGTPAEFHVLYKLEYKEK